MLIKITKSDNLNNVIIHQFINLSNLNYTSLKNTYIQENLIYKSFSDILKNDNDIDIIKDKVLKQYTFGIF